MLFLYAHPDDESFGHGGTIARYAAEGARIWLACATRGEAGRRRGSPPFCTPEELGEVRARELEAACRELGVERLVFLDLPDKGVATSPARPKAVEAAAALIDALRPQVVVGFAPDGSLSPHVDHVAMHYLAKEALARAGHHPDRFYYVTFPHKLAPLVASLFPSAAGYALARIRVSALASGVDDYRARRLAALRCHLTQVQQEPWPWFPDREAVARLAEEEWYLLSEDWHKGPSGAPTADLDDLWADLPDSTR